MSATGIIDGLIAERDAARAVAHRLRDLLDNTLSALMTEDGDQVSLCVEPDGQDVFDHPAGWQFSLSAPFTDEFWCDLIDATYEQMPWEVPFREAVSG